MLIYEKGVGITNVVNNKIIFTKYLSRLEEENTLHCDCRILFVGFKYLIILCVASDENN